MLGGGESVKEQCRTADIMADAAYVMLTKDSRQFTGNFCIDEDVLRKEGITDFDKYKCVPGKSVLNTSRYRSSARSLQSPSVQ